MMAEEIENLKKQLKEAKEKLAHKQRVDDLRRQIEEVNSQLNDPVTSRPCKRSRSTVEDGSASETNLFPVGFELDMANEGGVYLFSMQHAVIHNLFCVQIAVIGCDLKVVCLE
jgi:hypothetical protein